MFKICYINDEEMVHMYIFIGNNDEPDRDELFEKETREIEYMWR